MERMSKVKNPMMKIFAYTYTNPLIEEPPLADMWGWEIDCVYEDLGQRVELEEMLRVCSEEPPAYVLIRRIEELGDTVDEVSSRLSLFQTQGIVLIAIAQNYNSSRHLAHPHIELLKLLKYVQSEHHRRRLRQAHALKRLDVNPPPGKPPYGYKRGQNKYIIDRTTAPVVKEFFDYYLIYACLRGAVRHIYKKYGKKISVTTGKRWLTNPVYRGDTAYHNNEVITDTHQPIISREEAAQIERLLRRNQRIPRRSASAPRSLAGIVRCAQCNSPMTITRVNQRQKHREYLYLRPITCPQRPKCQAIAYQQVLEQTIETICQQLPQAVAQLTQFDSRPNTTISGEITQKQQIIEQIPQLVRTGILDTATGKLRAYNLRTQISQLQAQLASLPPANLLSIAQTVSIPQFWLDLSETERRFYLREFIRQIDLHRNGQDWEVRIQFIF